MELVAQLFFEVVCFYAGKSTIFLVTLGRRNPEWNFSSSKSNWISALGLSVLTALVAASFAVLY